MSQDTIELKVASTTDPKKLAWAIRKNHEEGRKIEMVGVGVACVAIGIKALIHANALLSYQGVLLVALPLFGTQPDATKEDGEVVEVRLRLLLKP